MKYAHNNNGILQDVIMTDPFIIFDKGYAATFIEVPDAAQSGYLWDGETLTAPTVSAPTPEEIQSSIIQAVQLRLDTFAKSRNYDSILSASTYATSAVLRFQTEGQTAVNARDNTWATLYTILGEVQAGARPMPSAYADIEAELPALEWPV